MPTIFYAERDRLHELHAETYSRLTGSFHFHSYLEFLWVREGEAKAYINNKIEYVRKNELAVILGHEAHRFHSDAEGVFTCVFIPTILCPAFLEAVRNKEARSSVIRDPDAMKRIVGAFDVLMHEELNPIETTGYIHVFLGTVLSQMKLSQTEPALDDALYTRLFLYINEHYKEELTVEGLAKHFGYSEHHLSHCFRTQFRQSIGTYINTLRLKNAIALLRESEGSITECAMESGFSSLRTFYRVFHEEMGMSPREYLRRDG